jgi:hypothetical protein
MSARRNFAVIDPDESKVGWLQLKRQSRFEGNLVPKRPAEEAKCGATNFVREPKRQRHACGWTLLRHGLAPVG